MKLSELKAIIKECINEVLAEQYLKTLAETKKPVPYAIEPIVQKKSQTIEKIDEQVRKKLMINENPYAEMYEDTIANTLPKLESPQTAGVSEDLMEKMGAYDQDYSRYE